MAEPATESPRRRDPRVVLLAVLVSLGVFYTLYFARQVILPIVIAVLLNFLFSPLVRWLKRRLKLPYGLSAALIITLLVVVVGGTVYSLAAPAAEWVTKAPTSMHRIETKLKLLKRPVEQINKTAERVEDLTNLSGGNDATQVQVKGGGIRAAIFGSTQSLITGAALVLTLLFFLLADGDVFMAKIVKVLPRLRDKKLALSIAQETEQSISIYLVATTAINVVLGILTGVAMWLIGLPNPTLWGIVGGLLNFVPYIGGLVAVIVLTLAGMATFERTGAALLPGIIYFVLTNVESFVTPYILGKRLSLNPVVVFIAVLFWGWMWGIAGALLAVPIMATTKLVCDRIKSLASVGEMLGK
ncbi:MAG TPA: AI-2E family transporter [Gemmatimonadales bacterium]|jgi:predicted PurR-regulated permease PerM|nr:AI-2E family transporter [Gemmatimonadales bacterium]